MARKILTGNKRALANNAIATIHKGLSELLDLIESADDDGNFTWADGNGNEVSLGYGYKEDKEKTTLDYEIKYKDSGNTTIKVDSPKINHL